MSKIGESILRGAQQALDYARGDETAASVCIVHVPETVDVKVLRERFGMTQEQFATTFGLATGAVRDWEQGRRKPDRCARILLHMIGKRPDVVREVLSSP